MQIPQTMMHVHHWRRNDLYLGRGGGGGSFNIMCSIIACLIYDQANIGGGGGGGGGRGL